MLSHSTSPTAIFFCSFLGWKHKSCRKRCCHSIELKFCVSSVLKSPDGNWIALQSGQLSRPSLLTKRKSLVYSALERESGAVSAYEGMDSDNEPKPEPDGSWGAVLKEIHRKVAESSLDLLDEQDLSSGGGRRGSRDSEGNYWKSNKVMLNRKVAAEIRKPSSSRRTSVVDINFNSEGGAAEESGGESEERRVRRSRRKRKSKRETASRALHNTNPPVSPCRL